MLKDVTSRQMDSTEKILFHDEWLKRWKKDPFSAYPIYIEITPAGWCNHRCVFCAFDYAGYKKVKLPTAILKERVDEMAALGVKAIQYAGEGEPLLHRDMADIAIHTQDAGIEISMLTNGVLLTRKFVDRALSVFSWLQISLDAATPETHAKLHQTSEMDFDRILENIEYAAKVKNNQGLCCDFGVQLLLLPSNVKETIPLALRLRDMGVNYLTVKPYSHNPLSRHKKEDVLGGDFDYRDFFYLEEEFKRITATNFFVDFRKSAMEEIESERDYDRCLAVPTAWAHIAATGDVYACGPYLGDERFLVGNIIKQTFKEVWQSERRKNLVKFMESFDVKENCRRVCRMNKTNITLAALRAGQKIRRGPQPGRVNFI